MNPADLDALLAQTLADHKLSGSEKQALTGFAQKFIDTDQERNVARSRVFETARRAATDDEARRVLTWVEDALKALAPGHAAGGVAPSEACFSPGDGCLRMIVGRFAAARRTADLCVFTITDDRITRALLDAHRRGVRVRLVTDNDKVFDRGSDVEEIAAAGVPVKVDRTPFHMHHKFALFDGARLLNGSYNWTRGAANDNEENLIDTGDPRLLAAFQRQFDELWAKL
jgi:phosphatidylserine/phosphatidylglycerophosphate/cardiolipin synthase-like enzyme